MSSMTIISTCDILISDFLRQLTTFRVPGATSERQRIEALARFGCMFMGNLWDVFAAKHLPTL
jgi:cholesterol oxidase